MRLALLSLVLLLTLSVSLATYLEPRNSTLSVRSSRSGGLIETLMGDSRRLFATHFLLKADAYFHSGFYPGIFDNSKSFNEAHIAEVSSSPEEEEKPDGHHDHPEHQDQDEKNSTFLGEPKDWIDRFSRNFLPTSHTHLDEGGAAEHKPGDADEARSGAREILPWLKLSAELDPNRTETYVVSAYWLRTRLKKTKEAEDFLREGLRANPGNPSILFELGRIQDEAKKDTTLARNLWELALKKWQETEATKKEPDQLLLSQILTHLAKLEDDQKEFDRSIGYWELVKRISPVPAEIEKRIAEVKARKAGK
ncbi:MAG: hypothetical protein EXS30_09945 [Pedosphaera sp.]|nr:hypothetical protein [Pedosphaera sp.]